jgi:hypothetical protein
MLGSALPESEGVGVRNTLEVTRAHEQLRRELFQSYLRAYLQRGPDAEFDPIRTAFTDTIVARLADRLSSATLDTPFLFTGDLPDRVFAWAIAFSDGSAVVAVNARMTVDPEFLAHALVEEVVRIQQIHNSVDFEGERRLPYAARTYEIAAKHLATEVLGYEPLSDEAVR